MLEKEKKLKSNKANAHMKNKDKQENKPKLLFFCLF